MTKSARNAHAIKPAPSRGRWSASTTAAVAAVVIAAVAVFVSVHEARQTRNHNKLSVLPRIQFDTTTMRERDRGLYMANVGLGPAVLDSTWVFVGGLPFRLDGDHVWDTVRHELDSLVPGFKAEVVTARYRSWDSVIAAGTSEPMFVVKREDATGNASAAMDSVLGYLGVKIWYRSMYNEPFLAVSGPVPMTASERALAPGQWRLLRGPEEQ